MKPLLSCFHALYSLAVTPGQLLLSDSKGKAGSRDVKGRSTQGPNSRSFRPSTKGKEEEKTGDKAQWGSIQHTPSRYLGTSCLGVWGFSQPCGIQGTLKMFKRQHSLPKGEASNSKLRSLPLPFPGVRLGQTVLNGVE